MATKIIESRVPAHVYRIRSGWWRWWLGINALGLILSLLVNEHWNSTLPGPGNTKQLIGFYLLYSGVNYWMQRVKHTLFWRLHELHHVPIHMGSELCLWRHPVETVYNFDDDLHTQLYQANSALHATADLAANGEIEMPYASSGWCLACLLRLITERLSHILEQMGGDPDAQDPIMIAKQD